MAFNPRNFTWLNNANMTVAGGNGVLVPTQNSQPVVDQYSSEFARYNFTLLDDNGALQASQAYGFVTYDPTVSAGPTDDLGVQSLMLYYLGRNDPDNAGRPNKNTTFTYPPFTGFFNPNDRIISNVQVEVVIGENAVDKWWGSSEFGKYGWIAFGSDTGDPGDDLPRMPVIWVNLPRCIIKLDRGVAKGFTAMTAPGVTFKCTTTSNKYSLSENPNTYEIGTGGGVHNLNAEAFIPPGPG